MGDEDWLWNDYRDVSSVTTPEARFLRALVKLTEPKKVVELGCARGYSTRAMLWALPDDGRLWSFDLVERHNIVDENGKFSFVNEDIKTTDYATIVGEGVDFVFFDANHDLSTEMEVYKKLMPLLSPDCILVVHDTGAYWEGKENDYTSDVTKLTDGSCAYRYGERMFVEYLRAYGWSAIALDSRKSLCRGLTVLKRHSQLDNSAE